MTPESPDGTAEARELVAEYQQRPTTIGITDPLSGPVPEGKKLVYMNAGTPASQAFVPTMKAATEAAGWEFESVDFGLTPESIQAGFDQALRIAPDYIVNPAIPVAAFAPQCQQFSDRGIAVISISSRDEDAQGFGDCVKGIVNDERQTADMGKILAAFVVTDSGGDAHVLQIGGNEFGILKVVIEAFEAELDRLCSTCSTETLDVAAADIGQSVPSDVVGYVRSHPETSYVLASFDDLLFGVPAALETAGLSDVKLIGQNPQAGNLISIESGGQQVASVSFGPVEMSWRAVDMAIRLSLGQDTAASANGPNPNWLFTEDNTDLWPGSAQDFPWANVADHEAQYLELWGRP